MENIIEIGEFADFFEATMAKEILESNEVHCIITGINLNVLDTRSESKVKLLVNKNDFDRAQELLASFFDGNESKNSE